ncbi:alginate lyase family protein [Alphaproteobacteria bacterium]|nr:alginate lyase family protein [Alphaproteobacteria bacterium]
MPKIFFILLITIYSFSSSVFGEEILAEEAQEMLDGHVKQSALLKVPLPQDNRIIKDYDRYKNYRINILANNYHSTDSMWKEESYNGKTLTKELCMDIIADFKVPTTPKPEFRNFIKCLGSLMDNAVVNFDDGIKTYRELLLRIANSQNDKWTYKDSGSKDFNPRDYNLWGVLSPLTIFYAVNIDELNYTDKENTIIQQYFKKKAMTERFDRDGDGRIKCDITNPMNLWRQKHSTNNCGSVRLRTAPAELALAIIMQDEELWAKGLWDLDYTLSMIEEEGYFVPLSARGCKALGYTWDTSKLFSLNLEMLQLAGFNLLDYRTRHGKTVAEAYEMLFKQYEDITISNHIAKKGFGANSCGIKPYKTHNEFFAQEFGVEVKKVDEIIQDNIARGNKARIVVPIYDDYINWSIRFVAEKHPEWIEDKKSLQEIKVHPWLSQYYHVQPFEIYNANALSDNFNIWLKKNKIANIEAKKEKTKCASSELNGEYKVTWIFHNINGGYDPEIQGSEKLVIENCIGKFEGVKNFQPSAELRENLEVTLKSDGHIDIRGDLDLFEPGRSYFTSLEGNVSSGEIAGVWEEGDLIKIKLSKKPKISKLAEKKNSSCEDGSNGEYIASWFAASTKDDVGWEFVGTEKITFDDCEGKFEAAEDFQPEDWFKMSKALRKDLNVYIKPDGSIVISGDLDLDYSETQRININGKISSGEVLGYFNTG